MPARDRRLVRRLLSGDEAAFEGFFASYFPRLYRFALPRVGRDPDVAEEVVQAALCAAIAKLGTFRGEAALFTWLCTFCRHEISAYFYRRNREAPAVDLAEDHVEVRAALESLWAAADGGPEEAARRAETARRVHVALDHLPGPYADVLEWKYADDLPVATIASRLGVSLKAAESTLTRARAAFRDVFSSLSREGLATRPS